LNSSADRVVGYKFALKSAGIEVDSDLIVSAPFQHEGGYRACEALLAVRDRPTAIFVCNDMMAVGAFSAIYDAGLRVPDDISVVGYDDIPLAQYVIPRLTTIAQPSQEIGQLAVELLVRQLNKGGGKAQHRLLPVHLVERDSCGPLRGGGM
jgi:DNA-binding LacI/PurR family transcriptional regulator